MLHQNRYDHAITLIPSLCQTTAAKKERARLDEYVARHERACAAADQMADVARAIVLRKALVSGRGYGSPGGANLLLVEEYSSPDGSTIISDLTVR